MSAPTLFVCATPIGNLNDISQRLIDTLKHVDLLAVEDSRVTSKLLNHLSLSKKMVSIEKFSEARKSTIILDALNKGLSVALLSDAGTPAISDPGSRLVSKTRENGFRVVPIPGPSALSAFLSASGLTENIVTFAGFFPRKASIASEVCQKYSGSTLVFFESGKRILKTLEWLNSQYLIKELVLAKEISKAFERFISGSYQDVVDELAEVPLKGEWVFGVRLSTSVETSIEDIISQLHACNLSNKDIVKVATKCFNLNRNDVYARLEGA